MPKFRVTVTRTYEVNEESEYMLEASSHVSALIAAQGLFDVDNGNELFWYRVSSDNEADSRVSFRSEEIKQE